MSGERPRVSIVIPAYNEGEQIVPVLDRLFESVQLPCEVLVVVDSPDDTTIAVVEKYAAEGAPAALPCSTPTGRGPANAIRFGIDAAAAAGRRGHHGRRLRRPPADRRAGPAGRAGRGRRRRVPLHGGGQQVGGPVLKGTLSRMAGPVAAAARPGRHPGRDQLVQGLLDRTSCGRSASTPTTASRSASSSSAKAKRLGLPVAEIPTIWLDRQAGVSNFKLAKWIPSYLRWYRFAFGPRLTTDQLRGARRSSAVTDHQKKPEATDGESSGQRLGRLHRRVRRRGTAAARPRRGRASTTSPSTARCAKSYDDHPRYDFVEGDARTWT